MLVYFDGVAVTTVSLIVALVLGGYADAHPQWPIFRNEASSMLIAVVLTEGLVIGCVTSWIACAEHGLPALPWMALFFAIQIAIMFLRGPVKRFLRLQTATAAT